MKREPVPIPCGYTGANQALAVLPLLRPHREGMLYVGARANKRIGVTQLQMKDEAELARRPYASGMAMLVSV